MIELFVQFMNNVAQPFDKEGQESQVKFQPFELDHINLAFRQAAADVGAEQTGDKVIDTRKISLAKDEALFILAPDAATVQLKALQPVIKFLKAEGRVIVVASGTEFKTIKSE